MRLEHGLPETQAPARRGRTRHLFARRRQGQPVAARAQPQHPGAGGRAWPAVAGPRHPPGAPDALRRLRRRTRPPHALRGSRTAARAQDAGRRRIGHPVYRTQSHPRLAVADAVPGAHGRSPSAGARGGRTRHHGHPARSAARRTHRRHGLRRPHAVRRRRHRDPAPRAPARRHGLSQGSPPSWPTAAPPSSTSANTRSPPAPSVPRSRCAWPKPWAPPARPNRWSACAARIWTR